MATQQVRKYGVQDVYVFKRTAGKVKYSFQEFKEKYVGQQNVDEREFWNLLATTDIKASYADTIHESLFDDDCPGWNFKSMGDIMDRSKPVDGVTDSILYVGTPMSFFPWHCEDQLFYSVSYLHFGETKIWYSVSQYDAGKLEKLFEGGLIAEIICCISAS